MLKRLHLAKRRFGSQKSGKQDFKEWLKYNVLGLEKRPICVPKSGQNQNFQPKKGSKKATRLFCPFLRKCWDPLCQLTAGMPCEHPTEPANEQPLLTVLRRVHKVPPEAPCSHSNETHLLLMVPRLEKGFDASPNTKHGQEELPYSWAGPQSAEPSSCNIKKSSQLWLRKRALTKDEVQHWGNRDTAVPLAEPNSNPSLTKHDGFSLRVAKRPPLSSEAASLRDWLAISYVPLVQQKGCSECHLLLCQAHGFGGY